ncbi:AbrB/MazE/SpoVT family DNA-binding domain-containing protein [Bacillus testis]|uniref:AbrB/MazE/SpoVT family DNA-binding domain-containing protein n=1 Tax=Bacillus testis TaxID=1622072 RepID=UPI00067EAB0F|nr:AbrB/MazE/SpoVT family DNA-binding domain-containing protein [Bacillus testis]
MKALGIIRNIDSLGRVVIPKEVRDVNGWEKGQPMELFISENGLTLKPYDSENKLARAFENLAYLKTVIADQEALDKLAAVEEYIKG